MTQPLEEYEVGPNASYGRHDARRKANERNRGLVDGDQIVWGMDLVPYWRAAQIDFVGRHRL